MRKSAGFSLIELVIVTILLGLLAATAVPRMMDATEAAEDATVEGVAGGFATGVGLVRAQWELDGRPQPVTGTNSVTVTMDRILVAVDPTSGYPTGGEADTNSSSTAITNVDCQDIFTGILQSAPSITTTFNGTDFSENDYYTTNNDAGTNSCLYYLVQTIKSASTAPTDTTIGNGFEYVPDSGQVSVFSNN